MQAIYITLNLYNLLRQTGNIVLPPPNRTFSPHPFHLSSPTAVQRKCAKPFSAGSVTFELSPSEHLKPSEFLLPSEARMRIYYTFRRRFWTLFCSEWICSKSPFDSLLSLFSSLFISLQLPAPTCQVKKPKHKKPCLISRIYTAN